MSTRTTRQFPVSLAHDGTPCILGPAKRAIGPGETIHVFTADRSLPAPYPIDEDVSFYAVRPGDFLGVYTCSGQKIRLESFRVDSVDFDVLTATLADTLLIGF